MKLVDANVLINAVNVASSDHRKAYHWFNGALSKSESIFIPWLCLVAFIRVATHPRLFEKPMPIDEAMDIVDAWLSAPPVRTDLPSVSLSAALRRNLHAAGVGGNLVNDAWLAAVAELMNAEVVTFDADFRRFPGVKVIQL